MHKNLPKLFQFIDCFDLNLIKNADKNLGIIYRNYKHKINTQKLIKFANICKTKKISFFLSNNIKLALRTKINGVYLPAFNRTDRINKYKFHKNFLTLGSAHNLKEVNEKIKQGCEIIFLAPLFQTKKTKANLGIARFNLICLKKKIKFIALGGINKKNIKKVKMTKAYGLSGISLFQKKTGL